MVHLPEGTLYTPICPVALFGWLGSAYDTVQCMLTACSWAAVQVMLQVFTFAFLVVIGCVIIMTPVMLYVFRLVVRKLLRLACDSSCHACLTIIHLTTHAILRFHGAGPGVALAACCAVFVHGGLH